MGNPVGLPANDENEPEPTKPGSDVAAIPLPLCEFTPKLDEEEIKLWGDLALVAAQQVDPPGLPPGAIEARVVQFADNILAARRKRTDDW